MTTYIFLPDAIVLINQEPSDGRVEAHAGSGGGVNGCVFGKKWMTWRPDDMGASYKDD